MSKNIGVLALQGAFREHHISLEKLGVEAIEIRQKKDLYKKNIDGIILPGGESTVMGKLLYELDLFEPLKKMLFNGLPAFGTCAGVVLLAKKILNEEKNYFGKWISQYREMHMADS